MIVNRLFSSDIIQSCKLYVLVDRSSEKEFQRGTNKLYTFEIKANCY